MVISLNDLKQFIAQAITQPMDHKNLDKEVAFFADKPR